MGLCPGCSLWASTLSMSQIDLSERHHPLALQGPTRLELNSCIFFPRCHLSQIFSKAMENHWLSDILHVLSASLSLCSFVLSLPFQYNYFSLVSCMVPPQYVPRFQLSPSIKSPHIYAHVPLWLDHESQVCVLHLNILSELQVSLFSHLIDIGV